jgi:aerobic carbon-monoxide dehydrogenase large subunit
MTTTALGATVRRLEDPPLVTGAARYTDDLQAPGALHAAFVRAPLAHARVVAIDADAARKLPGVVGVFTAADLGLPPIAPGMAPEAFARPTLAGDLVRFMGEAVAVVVAETHAQALDAAELVEVDYDPLEVVADPLAALEPEAPSLFPAHGSNLVAEVPWSGEPAKVDDAEVVVRARLVNQRVAAAPMEPGAILAAPGEDGESLTVWLPHQAPFWARGGIAGALGMEPERVRVIIPAVGGAFGARIATFPEHVVVAALARRLGRPVRQRESRSETMLATCHGRAQVQDVELGATRDGVVTDLRVQLVADGGAYPGDAAIMPGGTRLMICGPYRIPRVEVRTRIAVTNTAPIGAYRGAGRPEATALLERMLDQLAGRLGMDPAEVRRRNLIPADAFPHETASGARYDSVDYARSLERLLEVAGYERLRAEQAERRRRGDREQLGIGLSCYVEITGFGSEFGAVRVEDGGQVTALTGTSPHGQGHETAWAQIVASTLGVPLDQVRVVHSDTALVARGEGTMGSRSLQVGGSAVLRASEQVVDRARRLAAHLLEAPPEDVVVHQGLGVGVAGAPATALSWAALAEAAADPARRPAGMDDGLAAEVDFAMDGSTFPFGAHLALVSVDTETGRVRLERLVTVDDCGRVVNPLLADGQVIGGIAQGVAQALFEEVRYDADGNLLNGTFTTYAIPSAAELPAFETHRTETPTPLNPLGAKGIGEAGTIGSTPAAWNAVVDALSPLGVTHVEMPTTPERVWRAMHDAAGSA